MAKATTIISRYWPHLIGLNGCVITAAVCSATLAPRVWTASAQLILPDATTNLDASLGTLGELKDQGIAFTNELSPVKVQTSILTSDDVVRPVWSNDPERDKFQSLLTYKKLVKVKPTDQSTTMSLEVQGSSPDLAKQRAKRLIDSYQRRVDELRQGTSEARLKFSRQQLVQAESNLTAAKNALAKFQQSTGLVNSEEQTKQLVQSINTLLTTQAQVAAQGQAAVTRAVTLSQRLGLTPGVAIKSLRLSENKEYQNIRQKLSEVETTLAASRGTYTDENPQIQALLLQRQELQAALRQQFGVVVPNAGGVDKNFGGNSYKDTTADLIEQLVQAESDGRSYRDQAISIQRNINDLKGNLSTISTQQAQLLDLQRKYDIAEGVYKGIVAQLEQAKITAFNSYPNVQVLDQAAVDPKPTSPKKSLIALGGLLAAVFGSGAMIAYLESRSTLMKPKDIRELESPVLVRIPPLKQSARALNGTGLADIEFQRLASAISLMSLPNHQLLVSSSKAGEGKTTVTLGLAMALVDLGFRVLVVDGDFHKAELSRRLGYGIAEEPSALSAPKRISSRLDLLPATSGLDSKTIKFLARGQFEQHLNTIQAKGGYDYVIVDSAPVGLTSETALMAKAIRNVLLVVRLGISDRPMVQETVEQLIRHDSEIIGLAVNGAEQRLEGYGYKQSSSRVDA